MTDKHKEREDFFSEPELVLKNSWNPSPLDEKKKGGFFPGVPIVTGLTFNAGPVNKFFEVREDAIKNPKVETILPRRGTGKSAGYDFYSKNSVRIQPGETFLFWTDVKVLVSDTAFLSVHLRSSLGIKNPGLMISNVTGIIDADYYENEKNDGNIGICLFNNSKDEVTIIEGDRIAQGIIQTYYRTDDDFPISLERTGGSGSTGKN